MCGYAGFLQQSQKYCILLLYSHSYQLCIIDAESLGGEIYIFNKNSVTREKTASSFTLKTYIVEFSSHCTINSLTNFK